MAEEEGTFDTDVSRHATLDRIKNILIDRGATNLYVKKLAPNDNSKNQPYFGPHLTDLAFLPTGELVASSTKSVKTKDPKRQIKYQTALNFSWIDAGGQSFKAPNAKLIYYPQYPEVRFSGFLQGSRVKMSRWMSPQKQGRSLGRWLILGVTPSQEILAYLATPESALSNELEEADLLEISNVFKQINIAQKGVPASTRGALIDRLTEIHQMGWIPSQKLNPDMSSSPYKARNGGGYTLEAMLGVTPNGYAEPDFLGWEVKQFGVTGFPRKGTKPTTLMTPEPDGGFYVNEGAANFTRVYGYPDKNGVEDRLNFGGRHLAGIRHSGTNLTLEVLGFDKDSASITDAMGTIALLDVNGNPTASWSFTKLMDHWKRKHAQAVYIPCLRRKTEEAGHEYQYGSDIELGSGTDFELVLSSMIRGNVYYDPGIKLENASTDNPVLKRRSQFRANHKHLDSLYRKFEFIDLAEKA
jgi:hypothetical protein